MRWIFKTTCALACAIALYTVCGEALAQNGPRPSAERGGVVLKTLYPPAYPPLARQARITGDVVVKVQLGADGSVVEASVLKGHPLLGPAVVESAERSEFVCRNCEEGTHTYVLTYTFGLAGSGGCAPTEENAKAKPGEPELPYPRVSRVENHVSVTGLIVTICDPPATIGRKVRSAKCLYLWRCGTPRLVIYE